MSVIRGVADPVGGAVLRVRLNWSRRMQATRIAAGLAPPQPVELHALIDTGAQVSCVEPAVVARLGLPFASSGLVNMPSAGGLAVARDYYASLVLIHPHGDDLVVHNLLITASPLGTPAFEVLIGRDVLTRCRLVYDGRAGTFALRY